MSGIVGIWRDSTSEKSEKEVQSAIQQTIYSNKTVARNLFKNENMVIAKSLFSFIEPGRMEASSDGVHIFVSGEIYNERQLTQSSDEVFADVLLRHYRNNTYVDFLKRVNGIYIAIVIDSKQECVRIITDRYGLKPFYIYHQNNALIFAPELKCFPLFHDFKMEIRRDVVDCFMQLEHFLGNETWFKNVEVAAPSMVYTFSSGTCNLTAERYWSWSLIKKTTLNINQAAEQMADLLHKVCNERFQSSGRVGVALSGGLDSRAIVAAVHDQKPVTYTFGTENSDDVRIARQVTKMAGLKHYCYDTYAANWLTRRFEGVWKTDGMLNMLHMHYSHLMEEIPKIMDINLSGFLGDAMLGGSYLSKNGKTFLNTRINGDIARHYYGEHFVRCDLSDSFFDLDKIDPYLFYNRGRRMIGMGAEEPYKTVPQRLPFMDIELMDLSYSLPDEYRAFSKVYNKALLLKYPEFYRNIPHATTGVPIQNNPGLLNLGMKKVNRLIWVVKYKLGLQYSFVNVQNWIKQPETAQMISRILDRKGALYTNYTSVDFNERFLMPHLHGKQNYMRQIMGALTFEIWLQQVMNGNYIPRKRSEQIN